MFLDYESPLGLIVGGEYHYSLGFKEKLLFGNGLMVKECVTTLVFSCGDHNQVIAN